MKTLLVTAAVACFLLYGTLCRLFDVTQAASRAGAAAAENTISQIK